MHLRTPVQFLFHFLPCVGLLLSLLSTTDFDPASSAGGYGKTNLEGGDSSSNHRMNNDSPPSHPILNHCHLCMKELNRSLESSSTSVLFGRIRVELQQISHC
jgi:hypothetical protein